MLWAELLTAKGDRVLVNLSECVVISAPEGRVFEALLPSGQTIMLDAAQYQKVRDIVTYDSQRQLNLQETQRG